MIVVVETNFILQWVFQQEQADACEDLFQACTSSSVQHRLTIPAFAIAEAGMVLERRHSDRRAFLEDDFKRRMRDDSGRAQTLQRFEDAIQAAKAELVRAENIEESRWRTFRDRLDHAEIIPLDSAVLEETIAIQRGREIQQFPDALVFASIKLHLEGLHVPTPAIFVSTDNDLATDAVLRHLRKLDCTFINSFANGVSRVRSARS